MNTETGSTCDLNAIMGGITRPAAGLGTCQFEDPAVSGRVVDRRHGEVVFDAEGGVADITSLVGDEKQMWLGCLRDQRWPCLANHTVGYSCEPRGR
jgi:hypothetical protein